MASIIGRDGRWRAQVRRYGLSKSKTFDNEAEAVKWAKKEEAAMKKFASENLLDFSPKALRGVQRLFHGDVFRRTAADLLPKDPTPEDFDHLRTEAQIAAFATPFKPACGVYFLVLDKRVVYVGGSINVHSRLAGHIGSGKSFDGYYLIPCSREDLRILEAKYILKLRPPLNFGADGRLILPVPAYKLAA
jgi:hypothetical protein